jgi:hypothetical protein
MLLTVVHVDGSKKGQTETFEQQVIGVGRDPSNQLVFDAFKDQDVSSKHAQFVIQGEKLMLQDMKSRNGTFVNGTRLGDQPVPVDTGSVIQFGDKGPKVQISFRAAPAAPGKKTQMISELQGQLQKQQAAGSRKLVCAVLAMFILAGLAVGGVFFKGQLDKRNADKEQLSNAEALLPGARKAAEDAKAADLAPATWKSAEDAVARGEDARKADKLAEAARDFNQAIDAFKQAKADAERADLTSKLAAMKEEFEKGAQQKQQQQSDDAKQRQKELDDKKAAAEAAAQAEIDKLKRELEQTKTAAEMGPLVDAALASNKIPQIESVLEKVKQKNTESPSDQLAKWQDQLGKRLEDLKSIPPRLEKAAQDVKARVVMIQATSYALPKSQQEKNTQIREFLTSATGTGFLIAKDRIVTAKELVEPWKFDPAALALKKKYEEVLGYRAATKIEVLTLNGEGIYTVTATNDPSIDNPTLSTIYVGADSFSDAIDQKVRFRDAETVEQVQVHKRDESNVAVLQLKDGALTPIPVAAADDAAKQGDQVVALGEKAGGPDVKSPEQARLYSVQAELTQPNVLGVGGFATWTGGPVLAPDGTVVGLIVEVKPDTMRLVSPSIIKKAAGVN